MNRALLIMASWILSGTMLAQESPTTPMARHLRIIQGPKIELVRESLTIVTWTTNNPGGSPVHYAVVHYGTDPSRLTETAKSPIRLDPDHASTVFRVRLDNLKARTTYYFRVESAQASGVGDRITSPLRHFSTRRAGE
jgi:phosphodiesterase/alkaline phosphatase D-like protein